MVAAVTKALRSAPLGTDTTAIVLDVATGDVVVGDDETRTQVPASTAKTLTAVTALTALGTSTRLRTAVVTGSTPGEIVLVGGGDATLTRTPAKPAQLPAGQAARPASLAELARSTAARRSRRPGPPRSPSASTTPPSADRAPQPDGRTPT